MNIQIWSSTSMVFLGLIVIIYAQRNNYDDLPPGPYCALKGCCPGRIDECSAPILGTLCYCDDFCNQTSVEDCCPDYWSHCKGVPYPGPEPPTTPPYPGPLTACTFEGRTYDYNEVVRKNCNLCKCERIGNNQEFLCERNMCMVNQLISDTINRERRYAWTAASNYSKFWGKTLDEGIEKRLGTINPERSVRNVLPIRRIYNIDEIPRRFDAYEKWPNYMSKIQDQGDCASSWAISTAAVVSDRFAIHSNGQENVRLSAQNLLSCDRKGMQSCKGGHLDIAWNVVKHFGLVDEDCFPYSGTDEECRVNMFGDIDLKSNGCDLPLNVYRTSKYKTAPPYKLGNETDIMYDIMKSGPVQATMKVHNDFFVYGGGIYERSDVVESPKTGYLSVRIVGWGEEYRYNGLKKYWKVANSWGEDWGEDGFFKIVRGINECEIESYVIAAYPSVVKARYPVQPMPYVPDQY